jgi:hypothetical protein
VGGSFVTDITVERRPGRVVFVSGLLGHRAVVESIAELLVDPDALDLALKVAAAGRVCLDDASEAASNAYDEAMNALAAHLDSTTFMFHDWDLEGVAAVVNERRAVMAA